MIATLNQVLDPGRRAVMRMVTLLAVLGSLPAIAAGTGPEAPDATAPAAVPAAVSAAPDAAPQAPAPVVNSVAEPAAAAPAADEFKPPSGYKKKTRDGKQVYCRSETPVGTRFPTEYCFTRVDLERIEKNKRSIQLDHATRTKMCTSGAACGGG